MTSKSGSAVAATEAGGVDEDLFEAAAAAAQAVPAHDDGSATTKEERRPRPRVEE